MARGDRAADGGGAARQGGAAHDEHRWHRVAGRASALVLTGTGALHLLRPAVYDAAVPVALGEPRRWVLLSGVAELVCAAALAVPRTRRAGGVLTTALLLAVWPGNVSMAVRADRSRRASTAQRVVTAARVPLQLPMLAVSGRLAAGPTGGSR